VYAEASIKPRKVYQYNKANIEVCLDWKKLSTDTDMRDFISLFIHGSLRLELFIIFVGIN
jgi:hypothetical protein